MEQGSQPLLEEATKHDEIGEDVVARRPDGSECALSSRAT